MFIAHSRGKKCSSSRSIPNTSCTISCALIGLFSRDIIWTRSAQSITAVKVCSVIFIWWAIGTQGTLDRCAVRGEGLNKNSSGC